MEIDLKLFFLNCSVNGADDKIIFSRVHVYNNGVVQWLRIGQFSSSCDVKIDWFPFDEQTCQLTFMSWDDDGEVQLTEAANPSDTEVSYDGEWKIMGKKDQQPSEFLSKNFDLLLIVR
jgi:hypothetical protein